MEKRNTNRLMEIYQILYNKFGSQNWWPGDTPFEVVIGAILTQNTSWSNVTRAIENIKVHGRCEPDYLYGIDVEKLSVLIRPSGFFKVKAQRLKFFLEHLFKFYDGELNGMFDQEMIRLREELLNIKGIGPETADSIILYAANKPIFVVDAYTRRIFSRHSFFPSELGYENIQRYFMEHLPQNAEIYNEYHALIVKLAKEFCKKRPMCAGCPLETNLFKKD